jgi:hypothetical protein
VSDAEFVERRSGRADLAAAAIDQDQGRRHALTGEQLFVAALDRLPDRGVVVTGLDVLRY